MQHDNDSKHFAKNTVWESSEQIANERRALSLVLGPVVVAVGLLLLLALLAMVSSLVLSSGSLKNSDNFPKVLTFGERRSHPDSPALPHPTQAKSHPPEAIVRAFNRQNTYTYRLIVYCHG